MPGLQGVVATIILSLLLACHNVPVVESFVNPRVAVSESPMFTSSLYGAGRGMGMGMGTTKSKNNNNNKKKTNGNKKNGMGGNSANGKKKSGAAFDVNASMLRHEKKYEDIMKLSAKAMLKEDEEEEDPRWAIDSDNNDDDDDNMVTEYVIAARAASKQSVQDWVPIAQLCLQRPEREYDNTKEILQEAVSVYCRELCFAASQGAPVFSQVARNVLQYGIEPVDSFYKHVYEAVVESGSGKNKNVMTKSQAKEILGLSVAEQQLDKANIKQAYRKLSFQLHPDRFEGNEEESKEAAERYAQVQLAFDALSSGVRQEGSSWYESLGGKARTDFHGPVNLLPLSAAQAQMERRGVEAAVLGLDPELVQSFVARNLRSQ